MYMYRATERDSLTACVYVREMKIHAISVADISTPVRPKISYEHSTSSTTTHCCATIESQKHTQNTNAHFPKTPRNFQLSLSMTVIRK